MVKNGAEKNMKNILFTKDFSLLLLNVMYNIKQ